ncbi:hypothetical protein [Acetobacter sicerae]|uniref:hypothetical protein n=1 Tax=Acetobacter sicerae TaxID=85325 RepID=UPI00156A8454|nr:hypothetical protein [Acetobacter sicerae]NHN93435.1 hypothetical protein [Acetobacter sicerae]
MTLARVVRPFHLSRDGRSARYLPVGLHDFTDEEMLHPFVRENCLFFSTLGPKENESVRNETDGSDLPALGTAEVAGNEPDAPKPSRARKGNNAV